MKIGNIYITGMIGSSYNEDGSIEKKGVELIDVVEQMSKLDDDVEVVNCYINSPGGYVEAGEEIAEFFASQSEINTIADGMCASIATVVHTSVPLQNRKIVEGTTYMIHNPWVDNQSGDAATLQAAADHLNEVEDKLEKHYSKATGQDKAVLSSFMKKDTYLTMDQCKTFGFASEILPKQQQRAVALLNTKNNKMAKKSFKQRLQAAMAAFSGDQLDAKAIKEQAIAAEANKDRNVKALMIETNNGTLETPFDDLAVGDPVMIDGEMAGPGSYEVTGGEILLMDGETIGEGSVLVVGEDGTLASIESPNPDAQNKEIEDMTEEEAKAALQVERDANATLKAEKEAAEQDAEEAVTQLETLAKTQSNYQPARAQAAFRQHKKPKQSFVTKASMEERRKQYKGRK